MRNIQAIFGLILWFVATNLQGATPDPRVALVASLYREFAWEEVVAVEPRTTTFLLQSEPVLTRYLAPSLLHLVMKDRACATERKASCSLDFTPVWFVYPAATDLHIFPGTKPNEVLVRFTSTSKIAIEISYDLVQVDGSWRIADIRTKDWSLVSILQDPP